METICWWEDGERNKREQLNCRSATVRASALGKADREPARRIKTTSKTARMQVRKRIGTGKKYNGNKWRQQEQL